MCRAKYVVGTVNALQSKPGGGAEWLAFLRNLDLQEVIDALSTLPGVGPKVAACIALFSLDQHHAIPVDTRVAGMLLEFYVSPILQMCLYCVITKIVISMRNEISNFFWN